MTPGHPGPHSGLEDLTRRPTHKETRMRTTNLRSLASALAVLSASVTLSVSSPAHAKLIKLSEPTAQAAAN